MVIPLDQFVRQLADSSLMSADEVAALIATLPMDRKPHDGEQLARELVRQKKLTAYQAQQVYAGNSKSLVLGNYVILDELGQGGMGLVLNGIDLSSLVKKRGPLPLDEALDSILQAARVLPPATGPPLGSQARLHGILTSGVSSTSNTSRADHSGYPADTNPPCTRRKSLIG